MKTTFIAASFNQIAFEQYNKDNNNILKIGLEKGLIIEVYKGYFMNKKIF